MWREDVRGASNLSSRARLVSEKATERVPARGQSLLARSRQSARTSSRRSEITAVHVVRAAWNSSETKRRGALSKKCEMRSGFERRFRPKKDLISALSNPLTPWPVDIIARPPPALQEARGGLRSPRVTLAFFVAGGGGASFVCP